MDASRTLTDLAAYAPFARRLALALLRSPDLADEAVQGAMVVAWRGEHTIRRPRAWLARTVRHVAANIRRREHRTAVRERRGSPPAGQASAVEELVRRNTRTALLRAVLELPEVEREIVMLRYYDDEPPRRIAAALGSSVDAVHNRLRSGIKRLRAALDDEDGLDWRTGLTVLTTPVLEGGAGWSGVIAVSSSKSGLTIVATAVLLAIGACTIWVLGALGHAGDRGAGVPIATASGSGKEALRPALGGVDLATPPVSEAPPDSDVPAGSLERVPIRIVDANGDELLDRPRRVHLIDILNEENDVRTAPVIDGHVILGTDGATGPSSRRKAVIRALLLETENGFALPFAPGIPEPGDARDNGLMFRAIAQTRVHVVEQEGGDAIPGARVEFRRARDPLVPAAFSELQRSTSSSGTHELSLFDWMRLEPRSLIDGGRGEVLFGLRIYAPGRGWHASWGVLGRDNYARVPDVPARTVALDLQSGGPRPVTLSIRHLEDYRRVILRSAVTSPTRLALPELAPGTYEVVVHSADAAQSGDDPSSTPLATAQFEITGDPGVSSLAIDLDASNLRAPLVATARVGEGWPLDDVVLAITPSGGERVVLTNAPGGGLQPSRGRERDFRFQVDDALAGSCLVEWEQPTHLASRLTLGVGPRAPILIELPRRVSVGVRLEVDEATDLPEPDHIRWFLPHVDGARMHPNKGAQRDESTGLFRFDAPAVQVRFGGLSGDLVWFLERKDVDLSKLDSTVSLRATRTAVVEVRVSGSSASSDSIAQRTRVIRLLGDGVRASVSPYPRQDLRGRSGFRLFLQDPGWYEVDVSDHPELTGQPAKSVLVSAGQTTTVEFRK